MTKYLIQGLLIGFAYVAPIGMQNLYVINTAATLSRKRAYQVALITVFFDITLALASFLGMGFLMEKFEIIRLGVLLIGGIAVVIIGISLIRSNPELSKKLEVDKPLIKIIGACFAVTWLNPQALIDGTLLLGGFRASLDPEGARLFIIGVCLASLTWFTGLATVVSLLKSQFNLKVMKIINIICGSIIIYSGLKLILKFIQNFI